MHCLVCNVWRDLLEVVPLQNSLPVVGLGVSGPVHHPAVADDQHVVPATGGLRLVEERGLQGHHCLQQILLETQLVGERVDYDSSIVCWERGGEA